MKIRSIKARTVARMILRNQLHLEELMDMDYETGDELEYFGPLTEYQHQKIKEAEPKKHGKIVSSALDFLKPEPPRSPNDDL